PCAIALGKGSAMSARLEALGDDGVCTCRLQFSRLSNRRCRAEHHGSTLLDAIHRVSGWQTKMKAYHRRSQVKHHLKPLLVKTRKRIASLRHGAQAELIIISSETLMDPPRGLRINAWNRVHEKV